MYVIAGAVGVFVVGAFVLSVFTLIFFPPKADSVVLQVLVQQLGSLGTLAGMVVGFFYGASQGSSEKDKTIGAVIKTATEATAATTTAAASTVTAAAEATPKKNGTSTESTTQPEGKTP